MWLLRRVTAPSLAPAVIGLAMTTPPDPLAICAELGVTDVLRAEPLLGGADAALFRVERESGAPVVLRVFRPRQRGMAEREAQVMPHAAAHGIPVPAVLAHGVVGERPAMLLAWAAGERSDGLARFGLPAFDALGQAAGRMLARIHALPLPEGWAASVDWQRQTGLADDAPLLCALRQVPTERPALLHLDLHPLNLFTTVADDAAHDEAAWQPDDRHVRISAVIDWGNAVVGDLRADLARTLTIAWLDAAAFPAPTRQAMQRFTRHLLAAYCAAVPQIDLRPLPLLLAWAGQVERVDLAERLAHDPAQARRVERWVRWWSWHAGLPPAPDVRGSL